MIENKLFKSLTDISNFLLNRSFALFTVVASLDLLPVGIVGTLIGIIVIRAFLLKSSVQFGNCADAEEDDSIPDKQLQNWVENRKVNKDVKVEKLFDYYVEEVLNKLHIRIRGSRYEIYFFSQPVKVKGVVQSRQLKKTSWNRFVIETPKGTIQKLEQSKIQQLKSYPQRTVDVDILKYVDEFIKFDTFNAAIYNALRSWQDERDSYPTISGLKKLPRPSLIEYVGMFRKGEYTFLVDARFNDVQLKQFMQNLLKVQIGTIKNVTAESFKNDKKALLLILETSLNKKIQNAINPFAQDDSSFEPIAILHPKEKICKPFYKPIFLSIRKGNNEWLDTSNKFVDIEEF